MLYPSSKIKDHLFNLGISPDDTVLLHGDAGITSQYIYENDVDPVVGFFDEVRTYLSKGTILVPSFTYSATKGELFNVLKTPSDVGLFSEKFRLLDGVVRSHHPIFSICAFGKCSPYFTNAIVEDCFGEGTFFDVVYRKNVKIITLGCALERITFVHFIEQKLNIPYRYLKTFAAQVLYAGIHENFDVSYFVRDLKIDTKLNLSPLEREALRQNKMVVKPFGRFKARNISSKDFFQIGSQLLTEDKYALVRGFDS
jgi:aminoglycoside 3-N-acetyltransferase